MKTEDRAADRHVLDHAARTFTAEWPESLAPDLLECIAAEIAILSISQELLEDRVSDVLEAILGVEIRLRALTIRPSLRVNAPHPAGVHDAALSIDTALSALNHPIHLLRVFRNETLEARDPPMPQPHLASDDRRALANILDDAIAALKQTASALHPLAAVATSRF